MTILWYIFVYLFELRIDRKTVDFWGALALTKIVDICILVSMKLQPASNLESTVRNWLAVYIHFSLSDFVEQGRGIVIASAFPGDRSFSVAFLRLGACCDEMLMGFGVDECDTETVREVVRGYDIETEIPTLVIWPKGACVGMQPLAEAAA